jgi:hypothetical protein
MAASTETPIERCRFSRENGASEAQRNVRVSNDAPLKYRWLGVGGAADRGVDHRLQPANDIRFAFPEMYTSPPCRISAWSYVPNALTQWE